MARIGRRAWWLAAALAAVGGGAAALYLRYRDEPPPADEDLRLVRRAVPDEANGFALLDLDEEAVYMPAWEDYGEEPEDEDYPIVVEERLWTWGRWFHRALAEKVVTKNEAVFRRLDEGLARPDFQVPELGPETPVPYMHAWHGLLRALKCRSRLRFEEQREGEAFEDALRLVHLGHRVQGSQGGQFHYLNGIAFQGEGCRLLRDLTARTEVSAQDLKSWSARARAFAPTPHDVDEALRVDYVLALETIETWMSRRTLSFFRPHRAQRLLAQDFRMALGGIGQPASARQSPRRAEKHITTATARDWLFGTEETVVDTFSNSWHLGQYDRCRLDLTVTLVMMALKAYRQVHGRLPDALDALVPEWLDAVPLDPFDGKPLRYSRAKRILYSVGSDFADAGGKQREDLGPGGVDPLEPVFKIEFE